MMQDRVQHQQVEQVVEVPVPMQQEEVVHVPKIFTQTRASLAREATGGLTVCFFPNA